MCEHGQLIDIKGVLISDVNRGVCRERVTITIMVLWIEYAAIKQSCTGRKICPKV